MKDRYRPSFKPRTPPQPNLVFGKATQTPRKAVDKEGVRNSREEPTKGYPKAHHAGRLHCLSPEWEHHNMSGAALHCAMSMWHQAKSQAT